MTFHEAVSPRLLPTAVIAATLLLLLSARSTTFAGSAKWKPNPGTGIWNKKTHWIPATIPNGSADTATFSTSNQTVISLSANTEVNGITFTADASPLTITASPTFTLTISGVGITNNSGITQNFVADVDGAANFGTIAFTNSATAGSLTVFTNNGGAVSGTEGGFIGFNNTSTAGNGTFTNNGGAVSGAFGGRIVFFDTSTAGNGIFTINGGDIFGNGIVFHSDSTAGNGTFTINGGAVFFAESSTAGNGTFTANGGAVSGAGGGRIIIFNESSAGSATLIANGGMGGGAGSSITFHDHSTGDTARVEVFGNGCLSVSSHVNGSFTIGSIEGDGDVFLGANNLTVGSNNLSTIFLPA
jgi:hypothetical protein